MDEAQLQVETLSDGSHVYSVKWQGLRIEMVCQRSAEALVQILTEEALDWVDENDERPSVCERCGLSFKDSPGSIMSMFNKQIICMKCKDVERKHPDYARACLAERLAVQHGEKNFKGIGLPSDLIAPVQESQSIDESIDNLIWNAKMALSVLSHGRLRTNFQNAIEDIEEWLSNVAEESQNPSKSGWVGKNGRP